MPKSNGEETKVHCVRLPTEMARRAHEHARGRGMSFTAWVKLAVQNALGDVKFTEEWFSRPGSPAGLPPGVEAAPPLTKRGTR